MVNDKETSNDDALSIKQFHRFLTMKEAATLLKVCQKTIRRWDTAGKIKCYRTQGNQRIIPMSEVIRLQAQQDIIPVRNPPLRSQVPDREFPDSSISKESPPNNSPPWRHDLKALKAQLKILHYLLMNSFNSNAPFIILSELMEMIKEIMMSIESFRPLQSDCIQLWERIMSGLAAMDQHELQKEIESMPISSSQPPKKRNPPKNFINARKNAHDVFFRLVRTALDSRIDHEEQQRIHGIIEGILGPYKRLTEYLVSFPEGTLEHDVTKLLLTSHPSDHSIVRNRWSVRTLARICQQLGTRSASKSQVGRFYKKIQWFKKTKEELKSPDPRFGSKMKAIGAALASLKEEDVLLYGDEFKFTSKKVAQYLQQDHAPLGLQCKLKDELEGWYYPVCALQITGVFDPINRRLETTEIPDLTFKSVAQGIQEVCHRFLHETTGKIVLIIDNATDHSPALLEPYLNQQFGDRLVLLYLPTYSPNNNLIEGVWKSLLMSMVRQCSTQEELRIAFSKAILSFQTMNSERKKGDVALHCPICRESLKFSNSCYKSSSEAINKHVCFNIPDLTPYTIDILTHSLDVIH